MREIRIGWVMVFFLAVALAVAACGPSQEEQLAAEAQVKFDGLVASQEALQAKRDELSAAYEAAAMAEEAEGEAEEGEQEGAEEGAEAVDLEAFEQEVEDMTADFVSAIVEFINSDPPTEGEPLTEMQQAAITMKSAEDMLVAREYLDKGGDYVKATQIYRQAMNLDPDNPDLQAALASAEENRFVSAEKFSGVRNGMSQEEVRAILGQVYLRNIRKYEDRGVVAWFYPTADNGAAAGVYFRKRGDTMKAYEVKYEAVEAKTAG